MCGGCIAMIVIPSIAALVLMSLFSKGGSCSGSKRRRLVNQENKNGYWKLEKDYRDTLINNFTNLNVRLLRSGKIVTGDEIYANDPTVENISECINRMYFNKSTEGVSDMGKYIYERFKELPAYNLEDSGSGMGANFVYSKDGKSYLARFNGSKYIFTALKGTSKGKYYVEPGMEGYIPFLDKYISEYNSRLKVESERVNNINFNSSRVEDISYEPVNDSEPNWNKRASTLMDLGYLVVEELRKKYPDLREGQVKSLPPSEVQSAIETVMTRSQKVLAQDSQLFELLPRFI